jgi:hypothetical protein
MSEGPPTRWVDDPSVPQRLREDLRHAAEAVPPGFDADAGLEGLRAAIEGGMAGTGAAGAAGAAGGSVLASGWLWGLATGAVTLAGAVAVGLWLAAAPGTDDPSPSPQGPAAPVVAPEDPHAPATPPDAPVHDTLRGDPQASALPPDAPVDDTLRREIASLARARALLESRPAEALDILERSRVEFAPGVLAEEREALTVLALHRLERTREATARGQRFLRRHPESPFAARIRAVVSE